MPRSRIPLFIGVVTVLSTSCYQDPAKQLDAMQQTLDLQATLEDLGNRTTELQFALDSLRGVIARQDTTLKALANLAGVPFTP